MSMCTDCFTSLEESFAKALDGSYAVVHAVPGDPDTWVCPVTGNVHRPAAECDGEAVDTGACCLPDEHDGECTSEAEVIEHAARCFLHGEDPEGFSLYLLASALGVNPRDVEALR